MRGLDSRGHELELEVAGFLREVGQGQFAGEAARLHHHRHRQPLPVLQGAPGNGKEKGPVGVALVVDDAVGVEGGCATDPLHPDVALVAPAPAQDSQHARVLVEPARFQGHLLQHPPPGVGRLPRKHRRPQGDGPLLGSPHVLEGQVGAVLAVLAQAAQVGGLMKPLRFPDPGIGEAGPSLRHRRGGAHHHPQLGLGADGQGPHPVSSRQGQAQTAQVPQGVGHDPLLPGLEAVGDRAASAALVGRVVEVEGHRPGLPVGQGQL